MNKTKNDDENHRRMFVVAVLNMTWQLAIVVLIPIVGGFQLDKKFDSLPALTITGFVIAMACFAIVLARHIQLLAPPKNGDTK